MLGSRPGQPPGCGDRDTGGAAVGAAPLSKPASPVGGLSSRGPDKTSHPDVFWLRLPSFGARFPRLTPAQSRAFRELLDLGRISVAEACGLLNSEGWRSRRGVVLALPGCLAPLRRRPKGEHFCPVGVPGVSTAARRGRGACVSAWVEPGVLLKTRGSHRKHRSVRVPGMVVLAAALAGD